MTTAFGHALSIAVLVLLHQILSAQADFISYANQFVDPAFILSDSWKATTTWAQSSILDDAQFVAAQGPWAVTNKTYLPPSNNTHDYASLRPYFWPDCSKVGNTTQLTDEQIERECPYVDRDGQFNPDIHKVNNTGAFSALADSVFYNGISWAITKDSKYSTNIATEISTWFLNNATYMTPNLQYSQLVRGPGVHNGSSEGVLDLKGMAKLVSGVLILRNGKAAEWTSEIDTGLVTWVKEYIVWLTTSTQALEERAMPNNHGSFYFNQLSALQLFVGDTAGAKATITAYFTGIFQNQIIANGDQPEESARTHPMHYRAYNLAAMVVNARIAAVVGYDGWNATTKAGVTIKAAADYAMTFKLDGEEGYTVQELTQPVAEIASVYGDPDGKYAQWMKSQDTQYPGQPFYLWSPGLSDSGLKAAASGTGSAPTSTGTSGSHTKNGAGTTRFVGMVTCIVFIVVSVGGPFIF
ncbi:chondroitin AC/alginate lyase [Rickenella mellea]|uniref:Chondroitin AC/alginate lyase n=1 Tax=Rickenella mellea TaxID=50990 RepID=A0A4Y7Q6N2_9AGAM|nr:chondroitin AC/alginate lyase [Rickenella mellea]